MFNVCRRVFSRCTSSSSRNFSVYTPPTRITRLLHRNDLRILIGTTNPGSISFERCYSKSEDDKVDCKPKDEVHKKNLRNLDECARPKGECPTAKCVEEKKPTNHAKLFVGVLALVGALAGLWYLLSHRKKEQCPPLGSHRTSEGEKKVCRKRSVPVRDPRCSNEMPKHVQYLLIGGGTASFSAFRAIKSSDARAKVLIISNEDYLPYMRPPLSKEVWNVEGGTASSTLDYKQWNGTLRSLFYEPNEFYLNIKDLDASEKGGLSVARGWTVSHLDVEKRKAILEDGGEIGYDKVLIATGATPKTLDVIEKADDCVKERAFTYRSAADFQHLANALENATKVVIIGGGFLGSELACSLGRNKNLKVTQVFKEKAHMACLLPEYLSEWTTEKIKAEGVTVQNSCEVVGVSGTDREVKLRLSNGESLKADVVIVAVGVTPETSMSKKSFLEVDPLLGGYLVNSEMQARSNVYVAGDAACFYDPVFGRRRIEHHDNAVSSGRLAGENMTGAGKSYCYQSMFWSDLGPNVGYEGIGLVNAALPTVGVFAKSTPVEVEVPIVPIPEVPQVNEVPEVCMPYLTPEQEAAQKQLLAEVEEKKQEADEARKNAEEAIAANEAARKEAVGKHAAEYNKGVVFYLKNDVVVGIVMWNIFNRMAIARQVLKKQCTYNDINEVAKLFNIHEE